MQRVCCVLLLASIALWPTTSAHAQSAKSPVAAAADGPVYVAYYWRAKPGKIDDYNEYIRKTAEPIDANARNAGAFDEVHTYLAPPPPDGQPPEWTHLRVFKVKNAAAADALGAALDEATKRVISDEGKRKANTERAATLRDFVRQERWGELK
jgi:hypothetical protein